MWKVWQRMVRGWPGRIVRDSGWVSCSHFTPVEISFGHEWDASTMNQFVLLVWCFLMKPELERANSQEQQQYSYREHGLCWSWTGGRCPVLRLTTYKAERDERRMTHSPFCITQRGDRVVEMQRNSGDRNHRSFTRFSIIW